MVQLFYSATKTCSRAVPEFRVLLGSPTGQFGDHWWALILTSFFTHIVQPRDIASHEQDCRRLGWETK